MAVAAEAGLRSAAEQLIEQGRVLEIRVLQGGAVITGIVAAAAPANATAPAQQYRVYIRRGKLPDPSGAQFAGECSCGQRSPCVHATAVALAAAAGGGTGRDGSRVEHRLSPGRGPSADRPLDLAPGCTAAQGTALTPPSMAGSPGPRASAANQRLHYLLEATTAAAAGAREVLQVSVWVSGQRFSPRPANGNGEYPRYVDAQDKVILRALLGGGADAGPWKLEGENGSVALREILATGRALWGGLAGPPLRPGAAREIAIAWQVLPDGSQQLACTDNGGGTLALFPTLEPPGYVDVANGECGALILPYPAAWLRDHWYEPPVAPEQVDTAIQQIERAAEAAQLDSARYPRLGSVSIQREGLRSVGPRLMLAGDGEATLYFLYNDLPVDSRRLTAAEARTVRQMSGEVLHEIDRDLAAEARLRERLAQVLPARADGREKWLGFMLGAVPGLRSEGWDVRVGEDFAYRVVTPENWYGDLQSEPHAPRMSARTPPGAQASWFNLRLGVVVEGRPVNLLPALTRYLQRSLNTGATTGTLPRPAADSATDAAGCQVGDHWLVRLDDGRYVPIALERIQRIANTLVELFDRDTLNAQAALTLSRAQTVQLAQLARDLKELSTEDSSLQSLFEELKSFQGTQPVRGPTDFQATLRHYQEEGVGWLQFLRRYRFGGLLADDMGLGKTVQTLAHLALEKSEGRLRKPALIVAPVSAIGNWQREIHRFTPHLKLLVLHGSRRKELFHSIRHADIVVTGYPLLFLDAEVLLAHEFYVVILDEAQTIKNPRAKVSQTARALRSEYRLCLTGTPLENHLGELWSLFDFLQPGLLGDERSFQRHYRTPVEKNGDLERSQALAARIAPFLLRRTKDAVARELPPKTEIVESIVLDERQRDLYDAIRLAMHQRVREVIREQGLARSQITILDALLKLRQVCCDPRLIDVEQAREDIPCAKLEWLMTVLPELVAEGRRVLLFSQFTSMLRLIETAVTELSIPYCLLTGETTQRASVVDRFQSGAVPLFLISLKAGGTALNLTAADTVIHYDPWWNPAVEAQATDRAHRIGQDKPVFVYKLIAQDTVEERILRLQADKHALASRLYTEKSAAPGSLSATDLEFLLS